MMMAAETEETSSKKILVVEDSADNRDIVVIRLRTMGTYEILEASNGREALEVGARSKPDLIFMDLHMPVMDGWEATRALRATEWGRQVPVIALTAYTTDVDRQRAFHAGCNDFVAKPVLDYRAIKRKVHDLFNANPAMGRKHTHP